MITDCGVRGLFVKLDITKEEDVANFKEQVLKTFGTLDILFCNAGVSAAGDKLGPPFTMIPIAEFERLMSLNVYGMIRVTQAFLDTFKDRKSGKIVITASASGYLPSVMMPQYSMSKIAVMNIAQTLQKSLDLIM
jgi:NAD(P)-dependent dehydrogenase (short-subunit alcohol dehydrogenase family)